MAADKQDRTIPSPCASGVLSSSGPGPGQTELLALARVSSSQPVQPRRLQQLRELERDSLHPPPPTQVYHPPSGK